MSEAVYYRNDPVVVECIIDNPELPSSHGKVYKGVIDIEEDVLVTCDEVFESFLFKGEYEIVEEAKATREAIAICKAKQDVKWLSERGIAPSSNATKRRAQIIECLKEEKNDGRTEW